MLDRGASKYAKLTSSHYWRSPLVQRGLERRCKISIKMHSFDEAVFERFQNIVEELLIEPMENNC